MSSAVACPDRSTYSLISIKHEARCLLEKGKINRNQHIYVLCEYIPAREWVCIESELEKGEFLLRDRICDLLGCETWDND